MKNECIYAQVMVQMYLNGIDSRTLAEKAGMSYPTLRRKLRGGGSITLEDALSIREALGSDMPLEKLFQHKEQA